MSSEQITALFGGTMGVLLLIVLVVWSILWFLVPFMIYFILHRLRRIHEDLYGKQVEQNRLLEAALRRPGERVESEATRNPFQ